MWEEVQRVVKLKLKKLAKRLREIYGSPEKPKKRAAQKEEELAGGKKEELAGGKKEELAGGKK